MLRARYRTLVEPLVGRAQRAPEATAVTFIADDGSRRVFTAGALHDDATRVARVLAAHGVESRRPTLLAMRYEPAMIPVWCATLYLGAIPSVLTYLTDRNDPDVYAARTRDLARGIGAGAVVTTDAVAERLRRLAPDCAVIGSAELAPAASAEPLAPVSQAGTDAAWLQFTSGTTAGAKGVAIEHAAALDHLDRYCVSLPLRTDDVMISWLPLYHDLGLLTALIMPLLYEIETVLMSPAYWVRSPATLLRVIDEFRGTICNMPTFGFEHCTRAVRDRDIAGVDLRSWRRAGSGGEPIRHVTFERFWSRFAPYGVGRHIFGTGYGMAENVMTATAVRGTTVRVDWIDRATMQTVARAVPVAADAPGATAVVSNGPPLDGTEIRIVDAADRTLPDRHIGEILVRSPHMMRGYYGRPELSAEVLRDGWLHSGDLGYLEGGELFICGRKKDLIIVGGHNVHAEDLEVLAETVDGIQPGRVVAFAVADDRLGTEQAVVAYELHPGVAEADVARIDRALRRLVLGHHEIALADVRPVPKGWIVKTSSGKLARSANRDKYLTAAARTDGP